MDKKKTSVFTESLLNYQVSTDPSPVLISPQPGEGAELYASFQIRVTPKSTDAVAVSKLYFILSLGNSETDISSSDEASSFSVSDDTKWQFIRISPGLYQASPAGGKDKELIGKEGIVFKIYNLPVNPEVQSTVIKVKEESYGTSGSLIKSSVELPISTSSFVKDFYFENFIAEKPVVELHGKAVLKWIGSDNAGYLLYSSNEPWNPPLDVSKQRTWTSPPLTQNTIFVLTATQVVNGETKRRDLSVMVIVKGGKDNNNIYTTDGAISSTRTVKIEPDQQLKWIGSTKNIFSVGGNTFSVDAKNNRIGVGTDSPTRKLHVEGGQFLNAVKTRSVSTNVLDINIGQDYFGYGNRSENFGINVRSSSSVNSGTVSRINFGDISTTTASGIRYLSFSVGRNLNELMYLTDKDGGKVGIGTITPTNLLHINSSNKGAVRIVDGTQGTDKVLTSDASGVGTWKSLPEKTIDTNIYKNDGILTGNRTVTQNTNTLAFKGSAVNAFSVDGKTFSVDAKNGRVGIGTDEPTKKLHVEGNSLLNGRTQIKELEVLSSPDNPGRIISHRGLRFTTGVTENATDMIIEENGKVGVGTANPTEKLDVEGMIKASGLIIEKGQVKMFGKAIGMKSGDNWKANTDGIFIGQVYPPKKDEEQQITAIYGYASEIMMGMACGYSANVPNGTLNIGDVFSMPVKKGDKFSCKVDVLRGSELTTQFYWIPLGNNDLNTFEYIGEFTGGDSFENDMIVVEEDSFSSLFSKTMKKLMEDVPKEQREAKMERIARKLMEG